MDLQPPAAVAPDRSWPWRKWGLQAIVLVLVLYGIWRTMARSFDELARSGLSWRDLNPWWLMAAAFAYLVGMVPWGLFWHRVLGAMGQPTPRWEALRAYVISQPGKYVPGKFMVVVLRTAMIRRQQVDATLAAASVFVETLSVMSIGAAVGAAMTAVSLAGDERLVLFAIGAAVGVGIPTLPPVLRQVAKLTRLHRLHPEIDLALAGLSLRGLAPGWLSVAGGWCVIGVSLWATLQAIPTERLESGSWGNLPLLIACASLSAVAGFISGLPGGLGAREWVVMALITPSFGGPAAILSAIVHRGVMVMAELVAGGVLLAGRSRQRPARP